MEDWGRPLPGHSGRRGLPLPVSHSRSDGRKTVPRADEETAQRMSCGTWI